MHIPDSLPSFSEVFTYLYGHPFLWAFILSSSGHSMFSFQLTTMIIISQSLLQEVPSFKFPLFYFPSISLPQLPLNSISCFPEVFPLHIPITLSSPNHPIVVFLLFLHHNSSLKLCFFFHFFIWLSLIPLHYLCVSSVERFTCSLFCHLTTKPLLPEWKITGKRDHACG